MAGKGELILTGQLGDVMRESAQAAVSYIRAHASEWSIDPDFNEKLDLHIHVPAAATPKGRAVGGHHDGDRAGLGAHGVPGPPRRRDDRRDHAARPRAAHRRPQGEAARRAPGRHQDRPHPEGQRARPRAAAAARARRDRDRALSQACTRCSSARSSPRAARRPRGARWGPGRPPTRGPVRRGQKSGGRPPRAGDGGGGGLSGKNRLRGGMAGGEGGGVGDAVHRVRREPASGCEVPQPRHPRSRAGGRDGRVRARCGRPPGGPDRRAALDRRPRA